MCEIIPSVESGEAATADCASWWIAMGSKTYHLDCVTQNEVNFMIIIIIRSSVTSNIICERTLIVSSQLHPAKNKKSRASRVTHFINGSCCCTAVAFSCGALAGMGVWDFAPGIRVPFIVPGYMVCMLDCKMVLYSHSRLHTRTTRKMVRRALAAFFTRDMSVSYIWTLGL